MFKTRSDPFRPKCYKFQPRRRAVIKTIWSKECRCKCANHILAFGQSQNSPRYGVIIRSGHVGADKLTKATFWLLLIPQNQLDELAALTTDERTMETNERAVKA